MTGLTYCVFALCSYYVARCWCRNKLSWDSLGAALFQDSLQRLWAAAFQKCLCFICFFSPALLPSSSTCQYSSAPLCIEKVHTKETLSSKVWCTAVSGTRGCCGYGRQLSSQCKPRPSSLVLPQVTDVSEVLWLLLAFNVLSFCYIVTFQTHVKMRPFYSSNKLLLCSKHPHLETVRAAGAAAAAKSQSNYAVISFCWKKELMCDINIKR